MCTSTVQLEAEGLGFMYRGDCQRHAAFSPFHALSGSRRSIASLGDPIAQDVPVGNIEECGLRIVTGRSWREDQKAKEDVMIQNLEKNPTSIRIDSGAGESVCPAEAFPDYETYHTDKIGNLYRATGAQ